jgi:hypothetical protein
MNEFGGNVEVTEFAGSRVRSTSIGPAVIAFGIGLHGFVSPHSKALVDMAGGDFDHSRLTGGHGFGSDPRPSLRW